MNAEKWAEHERQIQNKIWQEGGCEAVEQYKEERHEKILDELDRTSEKLDETIERLRKRNRPTG